MSIDNDRILKVHKLGLGFQKVHKHIKGTQGSFNIVRRNLNNK